MKMSICNLLFLSCLLFVGVVFGKPQKGDDVPLEIPQGKIVGEWRQSYERRLFAAFESIPYAKPPTEKHRFEEAEKAKKWRGVLTAKRLSNVCVQFHHGAESEDDKSVLGNEDCLYLNVYSPKPVPNGNLPVIVYIHGGAFIFGSGVQYSPLFLMDYDVVYVSINYRLGLLGFMSAEDPVLPGNLGLKDQQLALKWVHDNIRHFGGNNKQVTIAGMSAGGASVHFHMLSPRSKGLFQRAISMSGTSFCPWTMQEGAQLKAHAVATRLGCPTSSTKDMVECLKHRPVYQIVRLTPDFMPFLHAPFSPVAPVVEHKDTPNPFLPAHPYKLVRKGLIVNDVPWLVSVTKDEGLYPCALYLQKKEYIDEINSRFDELAPHLYDFNYTVPLNKHNDVAKKIKQQYLGKDSRVTEDQYLKFVESMSDRLFTRDAVKTARLQSAVQKTPIYFYYFSYKGENSLGKFLTRCGKHVGVSHGDDTGYVIQTTYMNPTTTAEDKKMMKLMTAMWYNFATEGFPKVPDPAVRWLPVEPKADEMNYLDIEGPERCVAKTTTTMGRETFWSTLPFTENENHILARDDKDEL